MIDIHSHVLPMVDDGSGSWRETQAIFSRMAGLGYTQIVATAHWSVGMPNVSEDVSERARKLADSFGLKLSIGRECRIHPYLTDHITENPQLRLDGGNAVLVELPWGPTPPFTVHVFRSLIEQGYQPVLAHAARHAQLWERGSPLKTLVDLGVAIQVNLSTLGGEHGRSAQERALSILEKGKVSLVASDIHSEDDVVDSIERPLRLLYKLVGTEAYESLTELNPAALLESRELFDFSPTGDGYSVDKKFLKQIRNSTSIWGRVRNALQIART